MNDFLTHYCERCEKHVLGHGDLDADDLLFYKCLDCGTKIQKKSEKSLISPDEIQKMGYHLGIKEESSAKKGCRGGACGVKQL